MNLKRLILLSSLFLCLSSGFAQNNKLDRPKLVVGIVIDQMRWDYLYRYYDRYSDKGFRRLLNEGFSFENCMVNYIPSYTAIGHSTIYTGSVPTLHSITGNDFIDQLTGVSHYCTEDNSVYGVGILSDAKAGKMSPKNLKVTTITDQLKYATNFRSKVIGVALKDRGSILPAGHAADAAYWFDSKSGNWITSTYYMERLPQWVEKYNKQKIPEKYLGQDWKPLYSIDTYIQSPEISALGKYEDGFKGYDPLTFPMKTSEMKKSLGAGYLVTMTPYGNDITSDMAKLAITNEQLGKHDDTDFLAISFSSPDKMGHHYSINSILMEDAYLRLDLQIGDLLTYLDQNIGKGQYLVFLTADHGGTPNAKFMNEHGILEKAFNESDYKVKLNNYLATFYGKENLIRDIMNDQIHINYNAIEEAHIDLQKFKDCCISFMEKQDGIRYAVDAKRVNETTLPDIIKQKITNGYNYKLSGEIILIFDSGWYDFASDRGGTHGTWTPDDAHIPFVMMGWNVPKGTTSKEVQMTDIAPTLASMLHIQMPNGSIGKSRQYLLK